MNDIVILSGKGGVGKSAIAASLGMLLSRDYRLIMADADVDDPNLELFFATSLRETEEISTSEKAFIDYQKCTYCLQCGDVCRFSSINVSEGKPLIISYSCEGCGACAVVCPEDAIEIKNVFNGRISVSDLDDFVIVSGELSIGESSSGGIVDEVKKRARQEAERLNADLILTDGPPGIGCPVISSIKDSNYVIAVTEPTPAALSDLKRVSEVIGHFRIPLGLVVNKSSLYPGGIQAIMDFAEKRTISLLSEIPYDAYVPKAIAEAKSVVTAYPDSPSSTALRMLAEKLKSIIDELDCTY
jgi:MinD superfamily P-loop ATPase